MSRSSGRGGREGVVGSPPSLLELGAVLAGTPLKPPCLAHPGPGWSSPPTPPADPLTGCPAASAPAPAQSPPPRHEARGCPHPASGPPAPLFLQDAAVPGALPAAVPPLLLMPLGWAWGYGQAAEHAPRPWAPRSSKPKVRAWPSPWTRDHQSSYLVVCC